MTQPGSLVEREALEVAAPAFDGLLARVKADVAASLARAMGDPAAKRNVMERIERKRRAERAKWTEALRGQFQACKHLLTEEDVVQVWRGVLVGEVMES